MKKLFVAVLAVAALASCAQEEVILNNNKAITFGDAYVQNSTKAIYEGSNEVKAFKVWGTVTGTDGTVALYNGAKVEDKSSVGYNKAWECEVERFWTPGCDYAFYAVVDDAKSTVNATNGVPASIVYTADGETDLLYGATTKTTKPGLAQPTTPLVAFTMQHLLSKVSFKFTNTNTNAAYDYKVTAITVSGAYASGTYTIEHEVVDGLPTKINGTYAGTWGSQNGAMADLSFLDGDLILTDATGSGSNITASTTVAPKSFVIIPGEPKLNIAITVETLLNDTKFYSKNYTLKVNQSGEGNITKSFEKNTHYNFVVALEGGKPIDFTIGSVGDFGTSTPDTTIQ